MDTNAEASRFVVLAAIDGGNADGLLAVAARLAAGIDGGELHLVHAIGLPPPAGAATTAALEQGRAELERSGVAAGRVYRRSVIGHLTTGDPAREILQVAAQLKADLVIVGTHGRTGLERMVVGSVAEHVVRRASCPVLVVREKDYQDGLAPEIEPPCPDCLKIQAESNGAKMWCVRHSQPHPHAHAFYEYPQSFGVGSSIIRPD
jgi:nucleotide-binding universal stress UspA family protein